MLAAANVSRPRIVRAVGEPQRNVSAFETARDGNAFLAVAHRGGAHALSRIAEGPIFVLLVLKQVGIDGSGAYTRTLRQVRD